MVPHDRKFFLPVTRHVLSETIRRNPECSMYKTGMGFVAIHQFANNLLTKPWRPEFRTIKTYSGFYQQEIHSQLVDAERMFKEMGYKSQSNDTLVLKGTLCKDQVSNVSRDALAAYVECQIMSEVFSGLMQLQCTPPSHADIFAVRELRQGNVEQTIELIFEQFRRSADALPLIVSTGAASSSCNNCNKSPYYAQQPAQAAPCPQHHHRLNNTESVYANQHFGADDQLDGPPLTPSPPPPPGRQTPFDYNAYPPSPCNQHRNQHRQHYQPQQAAQYHQHHHNPPHSHHQPHPAAIPHSRSLDQYYDQAVYSGTAAINPNHHTDEIATKRHSSSFDQPGNDYGSSAGAADYHHGAKAYDMHPPQSYNMSGSRQPISANVAHHFAAQPYAENLHYATVLRQQQSNAAYGVAPAASCGASNRSSLCQMGRTTGSAAGVTATPFVPTVPQTMRQSRVANTQTGGVLVGGADGGGGVKNYNDNVVDSETMQMRSRGSRRSGTIAFNQQYPQLIQTNAMYGYEDAAGGTTDSYTSRCISDFDSTDELTAAVGNRLNGSHHNNSSSSGLGDGASVGAGGGTYASKCSDGIGSADNWNYVYTKLNKAGYNKDLGQRGDVLQTTSPLDVRVDDTHAADSSVLDAVKKTPRTMGRGRRQEPAEATGYGKTKENNATMRRQQPSHYVETPNRIQRNGGNGGSRRMSRDFQRPTPVVDEPLAPIVAAMTITPPVAATPTKSSTSAGAGAHLQPNQQEQRPQPSVRRNKSPAAITEWSCTYCTLLNPMAERVCAACAKSKCFAPNGGAKATTTCV